MAEELGLDYNVELTEPGRGEEQSAFHFLYCGAALAYAYAEPTHFPARSKRIRKRGARWLRQGFAGPGGRRAAIFLAQAMATLRAEQSMVAESEAGAERSREERQLVQRFYPLGQPDQDLLDSYRDEFQLLESREIPEGAFPANGFYMALLAGEEPSEEMIRIQATHAVFSLQSRSGLAAVRMILGDERYLKIVEDLRLPEDMSYEHMIQEQTGAAWWKSVSEEWTEFADFRLGLEDDLPELRGPIAQALRADVEARLAAPEGPLPDEVSEAISEYAESAGGNKVNWNVIVDSIVTGYLIREAECAHHEEWTTFDREYTDKLIEVSQKTGTPMAASMGALSVMEDLPGVFSLPARTWEQLCRWGGSNALHNSRQRLRLGMEEGEESDIPLEDCEKAVMFGYGLSFAYGAISGVSGAI